ncbi:hypothetical protein MMC11_006779 [Xylographa trunciseda]|nr:hypothetical protein [Xylographa trunciseda]
MQSTTPFMGAQAQVLQIRPEYEDIHHDEETLAGVGEDVETNEVGLLEDEDTLYADIGPSEWYPASTMKHETVPGYLNTNSEHETDLLPSDVTANLDRRNLASLSQNEDSSQVSPSHSLHSATTEDDSSGHYASKADDSSSGYCMDQEPEQDPPCLPEPVYQADENGVRNFSSRIPLGPGWVSEHVNKPTNRGDRQAQEVDWSSDFEHTEFEVEDCHTFIVVELGVRQQIPMMFYFSHGIQEVHRRLKLRYGNVGLKKALVVFHVIMGFNDAALVHGDEAPEWNSWRSDYANRAENISNPHRPTGLVLKVRDRFRRRNDLVQLMRKMGAEETLRLRCVDAESMQHAKLSEAERLASQDNPKLDRSQKAYAKILRDGHKKQYQKEVQMSGVDVTAKMAKAPFVKRLKQNVFKSAYHRWTRFISSGKSAPATRLAQIEREKITPWDKFESYAPERIGKTTTAPTSIQVPGMSSVPLISGSRTNAHVPALKKSRSAMFLKSLMKKKSSVAVQNNETFRPSLPTVEEVSVTTAVTTSPILAGTNVPIRVTQLASPVHFMTPEEHVAAARRREGKDTGKVRERRRDQTPEVLEKVQAFRRYQRLPEAESSSSTSPLLHEGVIESAIEPEEHPPATELEDRPLTPLLPESLVINRCREVRPFQVDEFFDTVGSAARRRVSRELEDRPLATEPEDRPLTPLLPESLVINRCREVRPFQVDEFFDTVGSAARRRVSRELEDRPLATEPEDRPLTPLLPESLVINRRREVRLDQVDGIDDTDGSATRLRVNRDLNNEGFGWHLSDMAQVRLRPRRAEDPMTPSPELMAPVRTRPVVGRFNPEEFGLGPRARPENVLFTQHKVKQVYKKQPGQWTPQTSEIIY